MKLVRLAILSLFVMFCMTSIASAQPGTGGGTGTVVSNAAPLFGKGMAGFGAAFVMIGAGIGFGRIGAAALESMSRQPEVADKVGGSMITIAALLEGATFFALIVCLLIVFFG